MIEMSEFNSKYKYDTKTFIGSAIALIALLFLFITSGGGLTTDWLRIYENLAVLIMVFNIFAIVTEGYIFDFKFVPPKQINISGIQINNVYNLSIILGIITGFGLSIGGLLTLSVSINPTLTTTSISSQFVTQFFAPYLEETFIAGIIFYTLIVWFKRIKIGPIIMAIGTIMTFIISVSANQIYLPGVVVIIIGLIFAVIYPLSEIVVTNKTAGAIAAVILSAFLFSGLHGYYLSNNPNFNGANILTGYLIIFGIDIFFLSVNYISQGIIFSIFAHMTYNGLQFLIQYPPITSTTVLVFVSIVILYILFAKTLFENPNFLSNLIGIFGQHSATE